MQAFRRHADAIKEAWFGSDKPSIAAIERAYWEIVESGAQHVSVAYGSDVDTAEFGSGFPLATSEDPCVHNVISTYFYITELILTLLFSPGAGTASLAGT